MDTELNELEYYADAAVVDEEIDFKRDDHGVRFYGKDE
jgi:hypothetical protein